MARPGFAGANGGGLVPSLDADHLFSRPMMDAGVLARCGERALQTIAIAADHLGTAHGMRLEGQLRRWGQVGDRVCAYAFGPGALPMEVHEYALDAVRRTVGVIDRAGAPVGVLAVLGGEPAAADNAFVLAERAWTELVVQTIDFQQDLLELWAAVVGQSLTVISGCTEDAAGRGPRRR
ncbi:hypothetical protein RHODGE_RHODGE_01064 [Rhodoplanes serenus]|uniref:Uncharacterized protein n=1 Tax=Rhodoplanes serenus TaxID=200615 RepID=A0A3S4CFK9_9BRAD|nr:hypothetical protein RHODGE_RHODGE_01064 [Rhodoplanes serenus]